MPQTTLFDLKQAWRDCLDQIAKPVFEQFLQFGSNDTHPTRSISAQTEVGHHDRIKAAEQQQSTKSQFGRGFLEHSAALIWFPVYRTEQL